MMLFLYAAKAVLFGVAMRIALECGAMRFGCVWLFFFFVAT